MPDKPKENKPVAITNGFSDLEKNDIQPAPSE